MKSKVNSFALLIVIVIAITITSCMLLVGCGESEPYDTGQYSPPQMTTPAQPEPSVPSSIGVSHLSGSYYTVTMVGNWILTFRDDRVISQSGLGLGTYKYKITSDGNKMKMKLETVFSDDESLAMLCGDCTSDFSYDQATDTFRFLDYTFARYEEDK